jgi:dTDP-4-dehydrorhamnose 3,5-epimerase
MSVIPFTPSPDNQVSEFIYRMPFEGMLYIDHKRFDDERGFYAELDRIPEIEAALGISFPIKQLNLSHSEKNVIRGFHAEDWNKLLSIITGSCFCAWADIRPDSETFGDVTTMEVGAEAAHFGSVFLPRGIANSFCAPSGPVDYLYAVDQLYTQRDTSHDVAISLFDPDLAVPWPISRKEMIVSERDEQAISLREKFPDQFKDQS